MSNPLQCLSLNDIYVNLRGEDKYEVIRRAGEHLVKSGCCEPEYIEAMVKREDTVTTYIGEGVAIPHGVGEARKYIKKTGLVVMQFPEGVPFGDELAYLVVGIAGLEDEHLPVLQALASIMMEEELMEEIKSSKDARFIYEALLNGGE